MADTAATSVKFWNNKKARNTVILAILVIIMLFSLKSCYNKINQDKNTEKGSVRTYICPKCEYTGKMVTVNTGTIQCPECSTKVSFAWKCRKCEREFAVKQSKKRGLLTKEELITKKRSETQCPNCNSFDTFPLAK